MVREATRRRHARMCCQESAVAALDNKPLSTTSHSRPDLLRDAKLSACTSVFAFHFISFHFTYVGCFGLSFGDAHRAGRLATRSPISRPLTRPQMTWVILPLHRCAAGLKQAHDFVQLFVQLAFDVRYAFAELLVELVNALRYITIELHWSSSPLLGIL